MDEHKLIKSLRYKSKLDLEEAISKMNMTIPKAKERARHSVQMLFKQVCEPCQDGMEFVEATVFCENCKCYMCCECGKADEKLHRGKNKHTIVPVSMKTDDLSNKEVFDKDTDAAKSKESSFQQALHEYSACMPDKTERDNNDSLKRDRAGKDESAKEFTRNEGQLPAIESIYIKDAFEVDSDKHYERRRHNAIDNERTHANATEKVDTKEDGHSDISDADSPEPDSVNVEEDDHSGRDDSSAGDDLDTRHEDLCEISDDFLAEIDSVNAEDGYFPRQSNSADDDLGVDNNAEETPEEETFHTANDGIVTESEEVDFITLRQSVDIRYHEYEIECDISDIACLSNGDIVIADTKNERLKVITPMGNKRKFKFDSWPWNLAVSCFNEMSVYVTLPDLKQIVLINAGTHFEKTKTIITDADCWGIVSTKSGLFVSLWNESTLSGLIQLLNYEGVLIRSLGIEAKLAKFLACPSFLATNQTETELYATDAENKAVHIVQIDGKLCRQFSYRNADYGTICGISVGKIGAEEVLYIADLQRKCVYKIKQGNDGKYSSTIILDDRDGLEFPRCLRFNNLKKTLLVSGYTDTVKIFK